MLCSPFISCFRFFLDFERCVAEPSSCCETEWARNQNYNTLPPKADDFLGQNDAQLESQAQFLVHRAQPDACFGPRFHLPGYSVLRPSGLLLASMPKRGYSRQAPNFMLGQLSRSVKPMPGSESRLTRTGHKCRNANENKNQARTQPSVYPIPGYET